MLYKREGLNLIIMVDAEEREALLDQRAADPGAFEWDTFMYGYFEDLIANSDLEWIEPETALRFCGDITDAPMLGIWEHEREECQCDGCVNLQRWAFMDYQIYSVQGRLADVGRAVFQGTK